MRCEGMRDSFHVTSYHIQAVKRRILTTVEQDNFQDRSYGAMSQAFCKYINRADWVPSHIRGPAPTLSPSFLLAQAIFEPNFFRINTPTFSNVVIFHNYPPMKMGQSVPKRRHIKFIRRGITQKKAHNIQNMSKVWNQEQFTNINEFSMKRPLCLWSQYSKLPYCCLVFVVHRFPIERQPSLW